MEQSIALVIINGEPNTEEKVKIIKKSFYQMNVALEILIDKTSEVIQEAIEKVTQMDPSTILDIIFVIHCNQRTERTFKTSNGVLDLYEDVINPLLCVEEFNDKLKVVLTSGIEHNIRLEVNDAAHDRPFSNGKKVAIVSSNNRDFINTFIPDLVRLQGNLNTAFNEYRVGRLILTTPEPKVELSAPRLLGMPIDDDHEFII